MFRPFACALASFVAWLAVAESLWGAGGTSIVAQEGKPAYIADGLPEGVSGLINHPRRTTGWNPWFTEWPNDVHHYAIEAESTQEINDLLITLAAVDSPVRQVRLSYEKEPGALGWVTRLPEKNSIPAVFSVGNQQQVNEWYGRVRKPFGQIEFTDTPVAVPPTLTLYVRNKVFDLDELEIPEGLELAVGGVPGAFHTWNTAKEKEEMSGEKARELAAKLEAKLDAEEKEAKIKIEKLVKEYAARAKEESAKEGEDKANE